MQAGPRLSLFRTRNLQKLPNCITLDRTMASLSARRTVHLSTVSYAFVEDWLGTLRARSVKASTTAK